MGNFSPIQLYTLTSCLLCLNVLGIWGYSAVARKNSKTVVNAEDATTVAKGAKIVEGDPPEVGRVLRAHTNAFVNIVPFLFLGHLYVTQGQPSPTVAAALFGIFALSRWVHTFAYLGGKQPFRTLSFVLGFVTTFVLLGFVVRGALAG